MAIYAETQYQIKLFVGSFEITSYLTKIKIFNSVNNTWPIVDLVMEMDNQNIIENDIYGKDLLKLQIWISREDGTPLDPPVSMDLLYLESNLDLPEKPENNIGILKDTPRIQIIIRTIPYPAFNVMTAFINKLWEEPTGKVPLDLVKEVLELRGILQKSIVEDANRNEYFVSQLIIPPMTVKRCIDYIDEKFAIFMGPMFRYCNYEGTFLLWDLTAHYVANISDPKIRFYKVSSQYDSEDEYWRIQNIVANDWGKSYIARDKVETIHYGNSLLVQHSYHNMLVTHPRSDLFYTLERDADTVINEVGIWDTNDKLKYAPELKTRKMYHTDLVGFENSGYSADYSQFPITSRLGVKFKDAFSIKMIARRNVSIKHMMLIGEVAEVIPSSQHEFLPGKDYSGAYIIGSSDLELSKVLDPNRGGGDNYMAQATLILFRTVQTKT